MSRITEVAVRQAQEKKSKRICFAKLHAAQPKENRSGSPPWALNVPFGEGFKRLFPYHLKPNKQDQFNPDSYWWPIYTEEEFKKIDKWARDQGDRVFLRDCLYTSLAMGFNFIDNGKRRRTEIGELEYQAKKNDLEAVQKLAEHCTNTIRDFSLYDNADMVCAIPPNPDKEFDLPSRVGSIVSQCIGKQDITAQFSIKGSKKPLKSAPIEEKWKEWDNAKVRFNGDLTGKKIILIDDKYQSGTTIQYIAMKLQEAGADQVLGLCMVKTMRDSDNQWEVEA